MLLRGVRVFNYKSFHESDQFEFEPGFNVIVGQNSAGKTALLEALRLEVSPAPHRSLVTAPRATDVVRAESRVEFDLEVGADEAILCSTGCED